MGSDTTAVPDDDAVEIEAPTYSLHMLKQVRDTSEGFAARDLLALQAIKHVLRGMLATQNLFAVLKLEQAEHTIWHDFLHDFKSAVGAATVTNNSNRSGKILITSVTDARGLPHEHVFMRSIEVYLMPPGSDLPRQRTAGMVVASLETQAERADDGLF
jgi:hypothetical protein